MSSRILWTVWQQSLWQLTTINIFAAPAATWEVVTYKESVGNSMCVSTYLILVEAAVIHISSALIQLQAGTA